MTSSCRGGLEAQQQDIVTAQRQFPKFSKPERAQKMPALGVSGVPGGTTSAGGLLMPGDQRMERACWVSASYSSAPYCRHRRPARGIPEGSRHRQTGFEWV